MTKHDSIQFTSIKARRIKKVQTLVNIDLHHELLCQLTTLCETVDSQ